MDWRREIIAKWLWHAFHGFEESEKQKSSAAAATGFIDQAQLRLLTAHIGHSLGSANNSGNINSELEKHFKEKEGHVNFQDYLEFLHTHTFIEPDIVNLKKLEESCWSLCQNSYDNRVSKVLEINDVRRIWKMFNFMSEPEEYPLVMCREETRILMEKLIVGTGNRWQDETFDYVTKGIQTFSFLKVMACFESNYAKGMDRMCVVESIEDLYDEIIEECEKKGWMHKKGHKMTNWKERWFVLKPDGMYYYTDKTLKTRKGIVKLDKDWSSESMPDQPGAKHRNLFTLVKRTKVGKEKDRYELSASDPRSRAEWIAAVQAVINSDRTESIHRIQLEERRKQRREVKERKQAEEERLERENVEKVKQQQLLNQTEKDKKDALQRLRDAEEERKKREEEEARIRAQEQEERKRIMAEIERISAARAQAEKLAQDEAAKRLAKELEEHERQLKDQEDRERQQEELDRLRVLYEEEVRLKEAEQERSAELEEARKALERLLEEERQAKRDEEAVRALQARLLEEEAERRKELEQLKEEQEKMLAAERERSKGLEQQSEELAKIQKEQAEQLAKEQEELQKLADERKAADTQLQQAMVKLSEAEKRREEQEVERKQKEDELARKKEERKRELDRRIAQGGLAKPIQVQVGQVRSHRGDGAFVAQEFDILKEIRSREKQLNYARKKSTSASSVSEEDGNVQNGETNGEVSSEK